MTKENVNDVYELIVEQRARIEELEAALRELIENVKSGSYESTGLALQNARAALRQK